MPEALVTAIKHHHIYCRSVPCTAVRRGRERFPFATMRMKILQSQTTNSEDRNPPIPANRSATNAELYAASPAIA